MNKETMKQGMIKVLNMYDIPWGNSAIDKIINTWADNKTPLIELLRHHPNWNDEKCYVAFDQNIKGQPDEEKIYNFINWMIIKGRRTDALFALRDYREQLLDERTASLIKECYPDIKGISAGQKTSRAVKKICTLIGITSNTYSDLKRGMPNIQMQSIHWMLSGTPSCQLIQLIICCPPMEIAGLLVTHLIKTILMGSQVATVPEL